MASAGNVQGGFQRFVSAELAQALQKMGIFKPNAIQANAIPLALSGRDVMIVAQTGSGKTLMFLLPILQRLARAAAEEEGPRSGGPRAIVLVPTEELARQVAAVAEQLAAALPSTHCAVCVADASSIPGGALVVSTPEQLSQHVEGGSLDLEGLLALAIDEADAILLTREGAKGCADELLRKCEAQKEPPQLFLAMAHLTQVREEELVRRFPTVQRVGHTGVLVPTLRQCFHYFQSNKEQKLLDVLRSAERDTWLREGTTLVFCSKSETAECLCELVDPSLKPQVLHEHANVAEQRSVCEAFRKGDSRVLLATDNAARGLDFPLLRHVVLYDVPSDLTAFVHCAGRTARRGQRGLVTCLVQTHEASTYQFDFKNHHGLQPAEQLSFQQEERPQERESPQGQGQPNEERRCDPLDGQWCTLGELRRRYQPDYSEAEVLQYWRRECKPSSKGRWVPRLKQVTNRSSR